MDMPLKPNILDDISKDVCLLLLLVVYSMYSYLSRTGLLHLHPARNTFRLQARIKPCLRMNQVEYA